ncbi:DUF1800 domain-containing protein [Arenimonas oryziterrae]|uniref:DUF1800 domain-containing protein n=1 Tax=Arenimonas oryziterrae DSM 21050 = YC6267 TaxID=1121015 RepID=A0A091AUS8_9GAMM|nr:DUF1800 domain-containing protein [Arenimonas oryziterrae]KFN44033.1 hypothetical protein N789_06360 [Arenimonas oryziterrae DSM 21050 = YC6267]
MTLFRSRLWAPCAAVGLLLATMWLNASAATPPAMTAAPAAPLNEAQKARLVLERLGFGARPGDVERVQKMGVKAWIAQQLQPESIPDAALAARLKGLTVPAMSTAELYGKYPNPTAIRQQVLRAQGGGRRGRDNADAAVRVPESPAPADLPNEAERSQMRQAIAQVYRDNGYGRPQQVYQQLAADRLLRATYSERQLQEVMVDFWSNHFNIYARKNVTQWFLPAFDREAIRPHALGNFRDLLAATAHSPAMLFYLDNFESVSPEANLAQIAGGDRQKRLAAMSDEQLRTQLMQRRGLSAEQADDQIQRLRANPGGQLAQRLPNGINENYARELMELHTLGVDGGYTQQDVREVARCFTGWTIADARGYGVYAQDSDDPRLSTRLTRQRERYGVPSDAPTGGFYFNARLHDAGVKTVLGHRIDAGGQRDGEAVIDLLASQPATARFLARKLAVKFVSDEPSPALVERVAQAFLHSKGDIRTTLRALFDDPEFFTTATYRAKIKTPFELVVSSLRTLRADTNGREIQALLLDLGEPLYGYQAPTGYPDTAADWVNTGALLKRMNFATALAANRIPGTRIDLAQLGNDGDPQALLASGVQRLLGGEVSAHTQTTLAEQLARPLPEARLDAAVVEQQEMFGDPERAAGGLTRGQQVRLLASSGDPARIKVVGLILGSPDFQRQ